MRKPHVILILLLACLLAAGIAHAETYTATGGAIPDTDTYWGDWRSAYHRILENHAGAVRAYESRSLSFWENSREYWVPCRPVGLQDLTGDGIPELIFMEVASGGQRGDLYVYTADSGSAHCALYVPGITRLDYDELLGFDIYLSGGALVIEHYEYEKPWLLQFAYDGYRWNLQHFMTVDADHSGEGYDTYIRGWTIISGDAYYASLSALRGGMSLEISGYMAPGNTSYGFTDTCEDMLRQLGGSAVPTQTPGTHAVYGLTIDKLSTRTGPGTTYAEGGTYSVKGQYIQVLAKAWDRRNEIWWVKCVIPYRGENRVLWTGYKRFDPATLPLNSLPEEVW